MALAQFLPAWQGVSGTRRGMEALVETVGVLAGAPLVASTLERDVLPARVARYRPSMLDELCTGGDVVWLGAGAIGSGDGRVRLCFADQIALLAPSWERVDPPTGALHETVRELLAAGGASFWSQLRTGAIGPTDAELLAALWDLVWAGEVTNDSLAALRSMTTGAAGVARRPGGGGGRARGRGRPSRLGRIGPAAGAGRWSLVGPLLEPRPTDTASAHATAMQLVERHGVVTREAVLAEGVVGGFASVYGVLKVLEDRGQVRRGYFVSGLGAAQFALPGAVDRLRSMRRPDDLGGDDDGTAAGGALGNRSGSAIRRHAAVAGVAGATGAHRRRPRRDEQWCATGLARPSIAPPRHVRRGWSGQGVGECARRSRRRWKNTQRGDPQGQRVHHQRVTRRWMGQRGGQGGRVHRRLPRPRPEAPRPTVKASVSANTTADVVFADTERGRGVRAWGRVGGCHAGRPRRRR